VEIRSFDLLWETGTTGLELAGWGFLP